MLLVGNLLDQKSQSLSMKFLQLVVFLDWQSQFGASYFVTGKVGRSVGQLVSQSVDRLLLGRKKKQELDRANRMK